MRKIMTKSDIERLETKNQLPDSYLKYLNEYFKYLFHSLSNGEPLEEFSLEEHGYIVILESDDDVRDLEEVGLNPGDGGLLGCIPEFVDKETLCDGREIYRIGCLYNNEYMMIFTSIVGQFDEEVETWLDEQLSE